MLNHGSDFGIANAARPVTEEEYRAKAALNEARERLYMKRHEASEKLSPVLQVIQAGNPEDLMRAADLLKPLAIEILSR